MKQKIYAFRSWVTLLLLALVSGAWGQTASIDLSAQGYANKEKVTSVVIDDNITCSFDKGTGSTDPAYYNTGTGVRVYVKNVLTIIPANGAVIKSIAFTYGASNSKSLLYEGADLANNTWTGSSNKPVAFAISGTSGHARVKVIAVTYSIQAGGETVATPTFTPASGTTFEGTQEVTITTATEDATIYYTTDGSDPATDGTSATYDRPFTVSETTTVKAVAVKDDMEPSAVATATYTKLEALEGVALVATDGETYYAMETTSQGNKYFNAASVNVVNSKVVLADGEDGSDLAWQINKAAGTIKTLDGSYLTYGGSSTTTSLGEDVYQWAWNEESQAWVSVKVNTRALGLNLNTNPVRFATYLLTDPKYPKAVDMPFARGYVRDVTAGNFGTICLPNAVAAADVSGAVFYTVAGKRMEGEAVKSVVLTEATELEAGVPYIFQATADKLVAAYSGEAVTAAARVNGLAGALTAINAAQDAADETLTGAYILSGNELWLCGAGCWLNANRAYLVLEEVPVADASVKGIELSLDALPTAVEGVEAADAAADAPVDVYTLSGVRIRTQVRAAAATAGLPRGIYLVKGEKVIVK